MRGRRRSAESLDGQWGSDGRVRRAYCNLGQRMETLAESDGDAYLPNPEPLAPVDYILICMEPSLGRWAQSVEEARERVASGFRNFLAGVEPMLLHYSVRRFLCEGSDTISLTFLRVQC